MNKENLEKELERVLKSESPIDSLVDFIDKNAPRNRRPSDWRRDCLLVWSDEYLGASSLHRSESLRLLESYSSSLLYAASNGFFSDKYI